MGYNAAAICAYPDLNRGKLGFFMYPQAESAGLTFDPYTPDAFAYQITASKLMPESASFSTDRVPKAPGR